MLVTVLRLVEVNVKYVELEVPVRYKEQDMPNDFPGRVGGMWHVKVDVDNGELRLPNGEPFPAEIKHHLHMLVSDLGVYRLVDQDGQGVGEVREDYVPEFFPGSHFGDYLIFKIEGGRVTNWKQPTADKLLSPFPPED